MINTLTQILIISVLAYSAYTDAKQRIIRTEACIAVAVLGIINGAATDTLSSKLLCFAIVFCATSVALFAFGQKLGGGDIKLLWAIALCMNLSEYLAFAVIATWLITASKLIRKSPLKEAEPLGVYIPPAYLVTVLSAVVF